MLHDLTPARPQVVIPGFALFNWSKIAIPAVLSVPADPHIIGGLYWGLYRDNGKEHGDYYSIIGDNGIYWDNGRENGNLAHPWLQSPDSISPP